MYGRIIALFVFFMSVSVTMAQLKTVNTHGNIKDNFNKNEKIGSFSTTKPKPNGNEQRIKLSSNYIKNTRQSWKTINLSQGITSKSYDVKPVAPIRISEKELIKTPKNRKLKFDNVYHFSFKKNIIKPVAPIFEIEEVFPTYITFNYYHTPIKIRKPIADFPKLDSSDEISVANMLDKLNTPEFSNTLYDCIAIKENFHLDDWPYFLAIKDFSEHVYGKGTNESAIFMGYILGQAGYKIRFARSNGKIMVLYASQHRIHNKNYYPIDSDRYYFIGNPPSKIEICPAFFTAEQPMSLWINTTPTLSQNKSEYRYLSSERYPDFNVSISVDKNLINLYDSYPVSDLFGNFMTRWVMYASTPLSDNTKNELYSKFKSLISGLSKVEAAERILNWVQTAFVYEYDDIVWGYDRAFFPEETLFYPFADCEDRSILFTRIIQDLLHLECLLVYYPGHLASAVCIDENVVGDYIEYKGKRYIVCDPTYIGAKMGRTMPKMDNSKANVIVLTQ